MPSRQPADAAKKPKLVGHSDNAYGFRPAAAPGTSSETKIGMANGLLARSAAARLHASTRDTSNPTLVSPRHVERADRFPTALSLAPPARTSARTTSPSFLARSHPTLPVSRTPPRSTTPMARIYSTPTRPTDAPTQTQHTPAPHAAPNPRKLFVPLPVCPASPCSRRCLDRLYRTFSMQSSTPPTKYSPHRIRFRMDACRRRQQPRSSPPLCGGFTGRSRCPTFLDAVSRFGIPTGSHTGAAALVPSSVAGPRRAHYRRGGFPPSRHCRRRRQLGPRQS
jgi:hypothetical protein